VLPPPAPVTVTLNQGVYIMAGGGFDVCGIVSLSAQHVMINISGTIYAAGPRADFENAMFGNANLTVISSCIFIEGGSVPPGLPAADFNLDPGGGNELAGVTESVIE
jgi:hypothetical protein